MQNDWIEITSVEQLRAYAEKAQATHRAKAHAEANELMDGLELEAKQRIDGEINVLQQARVLGRKMHAGQRVMMHTKIEQFYDELDAKATAQGEVIERQLAGTPVH